MHQILEKFAVADGTHSKYSSVKNQSTLHAKERHMNYEKKRMYSSMGGGELSATFLLKASYLIP